MNTEKITSLRALTHQLQNAKTHEAPGLLLRNNQPTLAAHRWATAGICPITDLAVYDVGDVFTGDRLSLGQQIEQLLQEGPQ